MDAQTQETIKVGGEEHTVVVRELYFPQGLAITNKATRIYPNGDKQIDYDVLIIERLKARVVLLDGVPPDWEHMPELLGYALMEKYGSPPSAPKN